MNEVSEYLALVARSVLKCSRDSAVNGYLNSFFIFLRIEVTDYAKALETMTSTVSGFPVSFDNNKHQIFSDIAS